MPGSEAPLSSAQCRERPRTLPHPWGNQRPGPRLAGTRQRPHLPTAPARPRLVATATAGRGAPACRCPSPWGGSWAPSAAPSSPTATAPARSTRAIAQVKRSASPGGARLQQQKWRRRRGEASRNEDGGVSRRLAAAGARPRADGPARPGEAPWGLCSPSGGAASALSPIPPGRPVPSAGVAASLPVPAGQEGWGAGPRAPSLSSRSRGVPGEGLRVTLATQVPARRWKAEVPFRRGLVSFQSRSEASWMLSGVKLQQLCYDPALPMPRCCRPETGLKYETGNCLDLKAGMENALHPPLQLSKQACLKYCS